MAKRIKILIFIIFSFCVAAATNVFALTVAPIRSLEEAVQLSDEIVVGTITGSHLNKGTRGVYFRTYGIQVEKCLHKTDKCPQQTYFKQLDGNNKIVIAGLPAWNNNLHGVFFLWKHVITGVYTVFIFDETGKMVTGTLDNKPATFTLTDFEKQVAQAKPAQTTSALYPKKSKEYPGKMLTLKISEMFGRILQWLKQFIAR